MSDAKIYVEGPDFEIGDGDQVMRPLLQRQEMSDLAKVGVVFERKR